MIQLRKHLKINFLSPNFAPDYSKDRSSTRWLITGIVTLAASLHLALLDAERFHPDEALYATWARHVAVGADVWLADHMVDKPPLLIYTIAALFGTIGASEAMARLPNVIASLGSLILIARIANALYSDMRIAWLAALTLALSPYNLLFAPTAFTDPLMLCWALLAWWFMLNTRPLTAGLAFGLSLATKQDALLLLPLIFISTRPLQSHQNLSVIMLKPILAQASRFMAGLALPVSLLVLWSLMRPQINFLQASLIHYGGLSLVPPAAYLERLVEWLQLARALSSEWLLSLALFSAFGLIRQRARTDLQMWGFVAYWFVVRTTLSFPIWDRYLLPLAPPIALLIARALTFCWDQWCIIQPSATSSSQRKPSKNVLSLLAFSLVVILLSLPARAALNHDLDLGGIRGQYDGVDEIALYFWQIDTTATVMYTRALSWELDYYTFGRGLDHRWVGNAEQLLADAGHMQLARRYLVLAAWEAWHHDLDSILQPISLRAIPVFIATHTDGSPSIYVYRLVTRQLGPANALAIHQPLPQWMP